MGEILPNNIFCLTHYIQNLTTEHVINIKIIEFCCILGTEYSIQ